VGPLPHSLNPALWGGMLHDSVADMGANLGHAAFWAAVLQIVFINILLSGDNAVVIAIACRDLPRPQKVWGLLIGAIVAVILRLVFTGIVGELMLRPYLKLVGGVALIYVAAKLLVRDDAAKNDVKAGAQLWRAVRIVVLADLIMSLDNVIAVAAVAQGNLTLLAIGLLASIPIIIAGAALIMAVLDRVPILVWAGAALLGWIAGDVIATDPAVSGYVSTVFGQILAPQVEIAASAAVALLVIGIGGLWRHLSAMRAHGAE
jgi:YjbE family integral membrane protein